MRHLEECFAKLTEIRNFAEHAAEVELALWFHDAIYEKYSSQNEVKSAELAVKKVLAAGGTEVCRCPYLKLDHGNPARRTATQQGRANLDRRRPIHPGCRT